MITTKQERTCSKDENARFHRASEQTKREIDETDDFVYQHVSIRITIIHNFSYYLSRDLKKFTAQYFI